MKYHTEELLIKYGQSPHIFTLQTLGSYGLYIPFGFFLAEFFLVSHHEHRHLYFNT